MKILVITTFYPHPERKDLLRDTSAVHYIAREWVKQGHQVTVLHCYGHYFRELVKELGKHDFRRYGKIQECPNNEGVRVLLLEEQFWLRNANGICRCSRRRWLWPSTSISTRRNMSRMFYWCISRPIMSVSWRGWTSTAKRRLFSIRPTWERCWQSRKSARLSARYTMCWAPARASCRKSWRRPVSGRLFWHSPALTKTSS